MSVITLDDAKAHLRVTIPDDDTLISDQIDAAEALIAEYVATESGSDLETTYPNGVPEPLKQAIKLLVAHFYENREATVIGNTPNVLPYSVFDLVGPYRQWAF